VSSLPVFRETADTVRLFDPATGEELQLATAPTDQLAEMRAYIRDLEEDLRLAKQALDGEVLKRMDQRAMWSWAGNGYTLKAPSPAPVVEFDAEQLRGRLEELVAEGLLSMAAVDAAVEVVTSFKARVAGINALRKLGGTVAEAVAECATEVDKPRRVSLGRVT
jgi:hypothetical protein